jgi:prophage regulatory protein
MQTATPARKGGRPHKVVILSKQKVSEKTNLSPRQIQNLVGEESFPKPVRLSERRVGWFEHEIDDWLLERPRGFGGPIVTGGASA